MSSPDYFRGAAHATLTSIVDDPRASREEAIMSFVAHCVLRGLRNDAT